MIYKGLITGCTLQFLRSNNTERDFIKHTNLMNAEEDWGRRAVAQITSLREGQGPDIVVVEGQAKSLRITSKFPCE